jgi:hypothetical protein
MNIGIKKASQFAHAPLPLVLVFLAACSSGEATQTVVAVTQAPTKTTELPAELPTAVPIAPTPGSVDPTLFAKVNAPVRSATGTNYPVYTWMSGGQTARLAGTNAAGTHYTIVVPVTATESGWINAQFSRRRLSAPCP